MKKLLTCVLLLCVIPAKYVYASSERKKKKNRRSNSIAIKPSDNLFLKKAHRRSSSANFSSGSYRNRMWDSIEDNDILKNDGQIAKV